MRATNVNAGLAESNGRLLLGIWRDSLHITCGLTACTPGSAPGPTLGNEYGKTLPFTYVPGIPGGVDASGTVFAEMEIVVYLVLYLLQLCRHSVNSYQPAL